MAEPIKQHAGRQPNSGPPPMGSDARAMMLFEANKKSMAASYILWFFAGAIGGHRFYNGRTGTAVAQLLMCVVGFATVPAFGLGFVLLIPLGIWLLVDAFLIVDWVRAHNRRLAHHLGGEGEGAGGHQ